MIDIGPPPQLWLPPRPAIIRSARDIVRPAIPFFVPPLFTSVKGPLTLTYTDTAVSTSDLTTYTFSTRSIGTAASGRRIIVAAGGGTDTGSAPAISSISVGGNATTSIVSNRIATASAALRYVDLSTGTTADIVVTFGSAVLRCGIGIWALYNGVGTSVSSDSTLRDDSSSTAMTSELGSLTNKDAIVTYMYCDSSTNLVRTFTWSTTAGSSNVTERFDATVETTQMSHSGASGQATATGTTTISCTPSAGVQAGVLLGAALR